MNLVEQIDNICALYPEIDAIQCEEQTLTYSMLKLYSDAICSYIITNYPSDNSPIAVYGHKDPLMIACFVGILKSGHSYVPIDINVPLNRAENILNGLSNARFFDVENCIENQNAIKREELLNIISANSKQPFDNTHFVKGDDVAYIIFTSGSTGQPKGVMITHDCIVNFLKWANTLGGIPKTNKVFANQAPFSFDLSVYELYMSLTNGGTIFAITKNLLSNTAALFEYFKTTPINIWVSTPSFAEMCLSDKNFNDTMLPKMEMFLFCGETLHNSTVTKLAQRFPCAISVNSYGPTESTVAVTALTVTRELNDSILPLPVGYPKEGTYILIVDENGAILEDGEEGEIMIVGDSVSVGYYNNEEQTKKVFSLKDINSVTYRSYRTGDKGYVKDKMLYYIGRLDFQIKLNGYRIELGDIENNLINIPFINNASCIAVTKNNIITHIAALVVLNKQIADTPLKASKIIKDELKKELPEYMIPKKIGFCDALPTTGNGKVDRKEVLNLLS